MNRIRTIIAALAIMLGIAAVPLVASAAPCANPKTCITQGSNATGAGVGSSSLQTNIKNITNILLFLVGAIAVIAIVIGGLRYVTSNGDSSAIKGAKDTILYAVIGVVVSILAYAIVNFAVTQFTT